MLERLSMTRPRQRKLAAFMRPASIHTGAWRYPGAWPDMNFNFAHMLALGMAVRSLCASLGHRIPRPVLAGWTGWPDDIPLLSGYVVQRVRNGAHLRAGVAPRCSTA